jgi:hypothetical protein
MRSCNVILAGLGSVALTASPLLAATPPCGATEEVARLLDQRYGELPVSNGLQGNGQLLQIFASPTTGSWTAVTTTPRGVSCVLATGRGWADGDEPGMAASVPPAAVLRRP